MDSNHQRTIKKLIVALGTVLPANVDVQVDAEGVSVLCDGAWMGTQHRTFAPGELAADDLEIVLDDLQDHVVHCVWGYWPVVSGMRGVLRVRAAGTGFRVILELEDAEEVSLAEFEP